MLRSMCGGKWHRLSIVIFFQELCEDRTCGNGSHNWSYLHHFSIPNFCRGVFFSPFRGSFLYYKPVVGFSPFSPPVGVTALGAIGLS